MHLARAGPWQASWEDDLLGWGTPSHAFPSEVSAHRSPGRDNGEDHPSPDTPKSLCLSSTGLLPGPLGSRTDAPGTASAPPGVSGEMHQLLALWDQPPCGELTAAITATTEFGAPPALAQCPADAMQSSRPQMRKWARELGSGRPARRHRCV